MSGQLLSWRSLQHTALVDTFKRGRRRQSCVLGKLRKLGPEVIFLKSLICSLKSPEDKCLTLKADNHGKTQRAERQRQFALADRVHDISPQHCVFSLASWMTWWHDRSLCPTSGNRLEKKQHLENCHQKQTTTRPSRLVFPWQHETKQHSVLASCLWINTTDASG